MDDDAVHAVIYKLLHDQTKQIHKTRELLSLYNDRRDAIAQMARQQGMHQGSIRDAMRLR